MKPNRMTRALESIDRAENAGRIPKDNDWKYFDIKPLRQVERETILHALERCGGRVYPAAVLLKITPKTIYNKLREWGIGKEGEQR